MKVFLIGGTGLVGSYLLPRLIEKGHEVYVLTREELRSETNDFFLQINVPGNLNIHLVKRDLRRLFLKLKKIGNSIGGLNHEKSAGISWWIIKYNLGNSSSVSNWQCCERIWQ
jgi:nucleoside-diphosphate-sugar epimerase